MSEKKGTPYTRDLEFKVENGVVHISFTLLVSGEDVPENLRFEEDHAVTIAAVRTQVPDTDQFDSMTELVRIALERVSNSCLDLIPSLTR